MSRKRKDAAHQHVAIEVCGSVLRMVMLRGNPAEEQVTVVSQETVWRNQATSLLTDIGRQELTAAFQRLAAEHKLAGAEVTLTLNGTYCVTRVVTGEDADVKRELAELEQRSQLYLSLGPGLKSLAGCVRQIDARHQHALLTVTNQRTLDAVLQASADAPWRVNRIEPSLFALSRTLEQMKLDQDEPIMVLSIDEKGVEVGIFFNGMLLLDYRPGGRAVHQNVAQIVAQHLPRLQRYCARYFRFITGSLNKVFVCGEQQHTQCVLDDFALQDKLTAAPLALDAMAAESRFTGGVPSSTFAPALGSAWGSSLSTANRETLVAGPNLLQRLRQQQSTPLSGELRKLAWPVVAAAAIVMVALGLALYQQRIVDDLQENVAEFETVRNRARVLRLSLVQSETKGKLLDQLSHQLEQPDWSKLWTTIGGCLPPHVWIDTLKIDGGEQVSIAGTCYAENGVYEFVRWLKQVPELSEVALTGTRPTRYDSKPAISFQLECELVNPAGSAGRKE